MTDTLFSSNTTTDGTEDVNYLEQAKKKFSKEDGSLDVEALLNGKAEADRFIDRLKQENAQARHMGQNTAKLEEMLEKLTRVPAPETVSNQQTPAHGEPRQSNEVNNSTQPIDKNTIVELVREALISESSNATRKRNLQEAVSSLTSEFGNNYAQVLESKARELGVNREFFDKLAQESPKALLALVKEQRSKVDGFTPPPNKNGQSFSNAPSTVRNNKYYNNLKKQNARLYWDHSTQRQLFEDVKTLGTKFYE